APQGDHPEAPSPRRPARSRRSAWSRRIGSLPAGALPGRSAMSRLKNLWSRLRRITKINLILGTIFALVFGYIAMATYFGTASQVRYTSNDFPGAKKAATAFLKVSPFQRHIGYFNR